MITLKNISFRKYLFLENRSEYDYAVNYAYKFKESKDIFKIGDFTKLPFGLVKELQYDMEHGMLWDKMLDYMIVLINHKKIIRFKWMVKIRLMRLKLTEIISFKNYIVDQIKSIVEIESKALAYEPTDDEIKAGIDSLNVFGVYNQMLSIARGNPLEIERAKKLSYEDAFVFLCNEKTKSEFERRLIEIKSSE